MSGVDEIYICVTPYHLYVTLLLIEQRSSKLHCAILLNANDERVAAFFHRAASRMLNWGYLVDCRPLGGGVLGALRARKESEAQFARIERIADARIDDFTLINFAWNMQYAYSSVDYYYKKCSEALFVEESALLVKVPPQASHKVFIKKITGAAVDFYADDKVKAILVQNPDLWPESWHGKIRSMNLAEMLLQTDEAFKAAAADILFSEGMVNQLSSNDADVGIIFTQPLSEDGWIGENEKIRAYEDIVAYYSAYCPAVVKLHPRDSSRYDFCSGTTTLSADFPSEALNLLGFDFEYAIGICTSAVETVSARKRINLNPDFLRQKSFEMQPLPVPAMSSK